MNIVVPIKFVPDLVEELPTEAFIRLWDTTWLGLILNEFDGHAIEQAILLKEKKGGQVTVVAFETEGVEDALYTAAAKGADRLVKLTGELETGMNNHTRAQLLAATIAELQPTLVLTGVQAHDDLDGPIGPLLAAHLKMPYVGYVAGVEVRDDRVGVLKEYPGGLVAQLEVTLPAVLGIQASENPPRYVAFSKIRQAMKSVSIEEQPVTSVASNGGLGIKRMFQPEFGERATMLTLTRYA